MTILKEITERIKRTFKTHYSEESTEFKDGWRRCNAMYEIAFQSDSAKLSDYFKKVNVAREIVRMQREVASIRLREKVRIVELEKEVKYLRDSLDEAEKKRKSTIKKCIRKIARRNQVKFITSRKEEREYLTHLFSKYVELEEK